jgi:dTMP kinase
MTHPHLPATGTTVTQDPVGRPLWVSIEGSNGVGKTTAARAATARLGSRCVLLDELTDAGPGGLEAHVIVALTSGADPFLRTGHPVVETLALLALQVAKAEHLAGLDLSGVEVILEDRGVDSVAAYQAVIMCADLPETSPESAARHVLASVCRWRRIPDATILLIGDPEVCARRFADRIGGTLTAAEHRLLEQIDTVYRVLASDDPDRYLLLDVAGMSAPQAATAVTDTVTALMERQAAHAS